MTFNENSVGALMMVLGRRHEKDIRQALQVEQPERLFQQEFLSLIKPVDRFSAYLSIRMKLHVAEISGILGDESEKLEEMFFQKFEYNQILKEYYKKYEAIPFLSEPSFVPRKGPEGQEIHKKIHDLLAEKLENVNSFRECINIHLHADKAHELKLRSLFRAIDFGKVTNEWVFVLQRMHSYYLFCPMMHAHVPDEEAKCIRKIAEFMGV